MNVYRISLILAFWFLCTASGAKAETGGDTKLLLELWVNDRTQHVIAQIVERNGTLLIGANDLASAGIKAEAKEIRADGLVDLYKLSGVNIRFSDTEQKLLLSVTAERLIPQVFDLRGGNSAGVATAGTGFTGQYTLVGTVDDTSDANKTTSGGASFGGTLFTPDGSLTSTGFAQTQGETSHLVRLDTALKKDDPDTMQRWLVGDTVSGSQTWSRSVRFGGIQMATDFALRPDLATLPLPAFFGQTAVPASVDVFVNSARVFETNVDSGPFQINNLPVITGSGQASVVVRDALGQESTVTLPFFASNSLLREGLSSYDFDAGFLRKGYGEDSFDYGQAALSGTYSVGVSDTLTVESHAEATKDVQLAGGGLVFPVAPYGTMHVAAALSHNSFDDADPEEEPFGELYSLSFETLTNPVGFFGSLNSSAGYYTDVASIGGTAPPKLQTQLGSHVSLGENGSVTGSIVGIWREHGDNARIATTSYTVALNSRMNLGTTGFYDIGHHSLVSEAFLSISLGGDWIGNAGANAASHSREGTLGVTKPVNPDGGVGYRATASAGDNSFDELGATWAGTRGTLDAALDSRDGREAGRLTASGGVVVMDGSVYTTRQPDGAVALVKTGQPNVNIYRENRPIATTDENGEALLTGLVPYTANHVSIDPANYSFSTIVETTEKNITPARDSGVVVDFTPVSRKPAIIVVIFKDGSFPPAGSRITLNGNPEPLVMGRHGEVFFTDLRHPEYGKVDYGNESCRFAVAPPAAPSNDIPRIGPVECVAGASL